MDRAACLDETGKYRYWLFRRWSPERRPADGAGVATFIMLNPSTADAFQDDPTIRRCIGFAKRLGYQAMTVVNLFALRSTDPKELRKAEDPVGPDNDNYITEACYGASKVICAWGAYAHLKGRDEEAWDNGIVKGGVKRFCLGTTKAGHPKHPLYLPNDAPLEPFVIEKYKPDSPYMLAKTRREAVSDAR